MFVWALLSFLFFAPFDSSVSVSDGKSFSIADSDNRQLPLKQGL